MSTTEYSYKTLVSLMKSGFNPPENDCSIELEPDAKQVLKKINETTVMLLKVKYLFKALDYSINLIYPGKKKLKLPNTKQGFHALMALYGRYFSDDIKSLLKHICDYASYKDLKNLASISPEMYLNIIKNMDHTSLKKDIGEFEKILKKYFEVVLKIKT